MGYNMLLYKVETQESSVSKKIQSYVMQNDLSLCKVREYWVQPWVDSTPWSQLLGSAQWDGAV